MVQSFPLTVMAFVLIVSVFSIVVILTSLAHVSDDDKFSDRVKYFVYGLIAVAVVLGTTAWFDSINGHGYSECILYHLGD